MAKYDDTKFYWLQLKEDFFEEDAIDWLEEQPNGKEYSLFYLKLCLKSLRTNGLLVRKVGNMIIPYDYKKLAELTKTNPDTVMIALQLLTKIGLVEILENGELYITQVENMIGSQSKSAFKKQQQRITAKHKNLIAERTEGGQGVDKCPPKIEIEEDKELELEEDKEKDNTSVIPHSNNAPEILSQEEIMFKQFWDEYPKKVNKKGAFTSFKRIKHLKTEFPLILEAVKRFKSSNEWTKNGGQFIPHPQTFINQERWKDEQQPTRQDVLSNIDMDGWNV